MLKKILTLSLVAVMLSVTAFADLSVIDVSAEDTEAFDKEILIGDMEFLHVTPNGDGTQTVVAADNLSTGRYSFMQGQWVLAKITVDENLVFDEMIFKVNFYLNPGTATGYCAPLAQADYVAATSGTTTGLVRPTADTTNVVTGASNNTTTSGTNKTITFELDSEVFNNSSSYQDGCIYLAIWGEAVKDGTAVACTFGLRGKNDVFKLLATGTVAETPVVDDFSDAVVEYDNTTGAYSITTTTTTGEAYLIIASFTGTTMNDVELVTIDAAEGLSGNVTPLEAGTIKIFLWDKATLAPAIGVS